MKNEKELKEIIHTILQAEDLFLVDLQILPENIIEVYIDSMKGVNVATCRNICKQLEEKLDRDTEDFYLTVASAGIGFPFKVPQQYQKNIGNEVEIKLNNGQKLKGILRSYSDQGISIEWEEKKTIEGKKKKELVLVSQNIDFKDIKEVKDIVIF